MKQRVLLLVASLLTFLCLAVTGLGEPAPRASATKPTPVVPPNAAQKAALEKASTQGLASLRSKITTQLARFASEQQKSREDAARALRTEVSNKLKLAKVKPTRIPPNVPTITDIYTSGGGATPRSVIIIVGSNLVAKDATTEIRILLGQQDLPAWPAAGAGRTPERVEATMPDFSGIAGPTPAQVVVKQGGLTSAPANLTVKPEIVQQELDLESMRAKLIADYRGTNLVYDPATPPAPHSFALYHQAMIGAVHRQPYQSPDASGTDEYFLKTQLKNNWVVKSVVFLDCPSLAPGTDPGQSSSALGESKPGTASLYAKVRWWNLTATYNQSVYYFSYIIEGPKGVPYK